MGGGLGLNGRCSIRHQLAAHLSLGISLAREKRPTKRLGMLRVAGETEWSSSPPHPPGVGWGWSRRVLPLDTGWNFRQALPAGTKGKLRSDKKEVLEGKGVRQNKE